MDNQLIEILRTGGVAVIPTDTIYGIVGSALKPETVEKIYKLKKRSKNKPFITLISGLGDLEKFNIFLTQKQKDFLERHWPNPISIVLSGQAFRMPNDQNLLKILQQTGSLVAPSANFEGEKPSETIAEAKGYFGESVSFYIDKGEIKSKPSTIIKLNSDGTVITVREGSYKIVT